MASFLGICVTVQSRMSANLEYLPKPNWNICLNQTEILWYNGHRKLLPDLKLCQFVMRATVLCMNTLKKVSEAHQLEAFKSDFDWFFVF